MTNFITATNNYKADLAAARAAGIKFSKTPKKDELYEAINTHNAFLADDNKEAVVQIDDVNLDADNQPYCVIDRVGEEEYSSQSAEKDPQDVVTAAGDSLSQATEKDQLDIVIPVQAKAAIRALGEAIYTSLAVVTYLVAILLVWCVQQWAINAQGVRWYSAIDYRGLEITEEIVRAFSEIPVEEIVKTSSQTPLERPVTARKTQWVVRLAGEAVDPLEDDLWAAVHYEIYCDREALVA